MQDVCQIISGIESHAGKHVGNCEKMNALVVMDD